MRRWIGVARLVALALVFFALIVRVNDPVPMQIARNLSFDFYQQLKPRAAQPLPVAIIDIDDPSLAEIGQWPWPRSYIAALTDKAMQQGAAAVAFDIIFSEPDRLSPARLAQTFDDVSETARIELEKLPDYDDVLADAFSRGRVVVGQTSVRSAAVALDLERAVPRVDFALIGNDPEPFLMKFPDLVENLPQLENAALGRGLFNVRPDPDGVYRRAPVVMSVEGALRLGLGPELLRVATGGSPFALRTNDAGIDGVVVAGQLIRTAADGTVRPYLSPSSRARYVSAADLINDRVPEGRLRGHLVFVGTSAIGLEDYRSTPLGVQMAGVEIHAQILENILSGTLLSRPNYIIAVELMGAFALCLVIIILAPIMNASILITSTLVFLGSYGWFSFNLFQNQRLLVDPVFPIWAGLATIMFMSSANYLREERRRRQIRTAFGQYVSRDLVDELSDNSAGLSLGGETRELTLLFSDVQGFTAIAESFREDPAGLTRLMNRFLNLLSNAILDENGTIDKFMGDAVMAFWNAPLDHEDHQRAACRAALQMIANVEALNLQRKEKALQNGDTFQPIEVGIGINTGICTVGNMGSDMRFDYTAMGDPVNLASRLEGQSRYYGMPIIVGASTQAATQDDFAFLELDLIRVKGKQEPERIFALLGDSGLRGSDAFGAVSQQQEDMLRAYRAQDWDRASALLEDLRNSLLPIEPRAEVYLAFIQNRMDGLRQNPPPADWDGVYDATSK
ncbi:MAG: CHASE2 domain-containing protein [Arenibacterium sp.]